MTEIRSTMLDAARKGDLGSEHGKFPAPKAIEGSPDIQINGKPVRVGDAFEAHPLARRPDRRVALARSQRSSLSADRATNVMQKNDVAVRGSGRRIKVNCRCMHMHRSTPRGEEHRSATDKAKEADDDVRNDPDYDPRHD